MSRLKLLGFVGAFLLQTALLGWIVGDRALLLANGTEIRLTVVPVDPRDLLRGDYVVLTYDASRLQEAGLAGDKGFAVGDTIYVEMAREGETWTPAALRRSPTGDAVAIRGKITDSRAGEGDCATPCMVYSVDYGIDRFYVPEGEGKELEQLRRDQRLSVDIAVAANGRAALKRLLVDGTVRYAESMF